MCSDGKPEVEQEEAMTWRSLWCLCLVLLGGRSISGETGYRLLALYEGS